MGLKTEADKLKGRLQLVVSVPIKLFGFVHCSGDVRTTHFALHLFNGSGVRSLRTWCTYLSWLTESRKLAWPSRHARTVGRTDGAVADGRSQCIYSSENNLELGTLRASLRLFFAGRLKFVAETHAQNQSIRRRPTLRTMQWENRRSQTLSSITLDRTV